MEVVNVDDVLVLQVAQALGFALEPGHHVLFRGRTRLERLDCHGASKRLLDGAVHHRHPAGRYFLENLTVANALEHGNSAEVTEDPLRNLAREPSSEQLEFGRKIECLGGRVRVGRKNIRSMLTIKNRSRISSIPRRTHRRDGECVSTSSGSVSENWIASLLREECEFFV